MHIPASDAAQQKRVGAVSGDGWFAVLSTYEIPDSDFETNLIEAFARPYPLMYQSGNAPLVLESVVNGTSLTPFSPDFIEYAAHVMESIQEGEWVEELMDFSSERLASEMEVHVASRIKDLAATGQIPPEMLTSIYRPAYRAHNFDTSVSLTPNPLSHGGNFERRNFPYLPDPSEADDWSILKHETHYEDKTGETHTLEALWLRLQIHDEERDYPLISAKTGGIFLPAASAQTEYDHIEHAEVSKSTINEVLTDGSGDNTLLGKAEVTQGSRTEQYLKKSI